METKELKITIPEGYCIDESKSTFEKIVFKKKDNKPRSWKEYVAQHNATVTNHYFIDNGAEVRVTGWRPDIPSDMSKNTIPSKELAEAFLAMMQLMSIRQAWIGDWEPDWKDCTNKWGIVFQEDKLNVDHFYYNAIPLSFPTKEMAVDFMICFKDLLKIAKPLI